jgi:hypothetical protein
LFSEVKRKEQDGECCLTLISGENKMILVYVVTYRVDSKSPQSELVRFTKEAADHFAKGIVDSGGVAIVTEDVRDQVASDEPVTHPNRSLQW